MASKYNLYNKITETIKICKNNNKIQEHMDYNLNENLFEYPLNTIKPDGILGFKIGDTMDDVFVNIRNLELMSDEDIKNEMIAFEYNDFESYVFNVEIESFKDLSRICFDFNRRTKKLNQLLVYFKLQNNLDQLFMQLKDKLTVFLRQSPIIGQSGLYSWRCGHHNIVLSYFSDFDVSNEISLSFDIDSFA